VKKLIAFYRRYKHAKYAAIAGDRAATFSVNSDKKARFLIGNLASENHFTMQDAPDFRECARKVRVQLDCVEDNYLLGPEFVLEDGQRREAAVFGAEGAGVADGSLVELGEGVSNQLHALCDLLAEFGAGSCTLVFVQTRYTAATLCTFLQRRFPSLGCEKLIGQGGVDGMRWKGDAGQNGVLQRFRAGTTKLIVCTSVLEEGSCLFSPYFPLAVWSSV
jgi:hypothetical protein